MLFWCTTLGYLSHVGRKKCVGMPLQTKKKKKKKNTPLNAVISEVSRDPFLFVLIGTYDSKVYNNDNSTTNNKKRFLTIWA